MCFLQSEHNVHILHRLSRRAFDEVVDDGKDDPHIGLRRLTDADAAEVCAAHAAGFGCRTGGQDVHERAVAVVVAQDGFGVAAV